MQYSWDQLNKKCALKEEQYQRTIPKTSSHCCLACSSLKFLAIRKNLRRSITHCLVGLSHCIISLTSNLNLPYCNLFCFSEITENNSLPAFTRNFSESLRTATKPPLSLSPPGLSFASSAPAKSYARKVFLSSFLFQVLWLSPAGSCIVLKCDYLQWSQGSR